MAFKYLNYSFLSLSDLSTIDYSQNMLYGVNYGSQQIGTAYPSNFYPNGMEPVALNPRYGWLRGGARTFETRQATANLGSTPVGNVLQYVIKNNTISYFGVYYDNVLVADIGHLAKGDTIIKVTFDDPIEFAYGGKYMFGIGLWDEFNASAGLVMGIELVQVSNNIYKMRFSNEIASDVPIPVLPGLLEYMSLTAVAEMKKTVSYMTSNYLAR